MTRCIYLLRHGNPGQEGDPRRCLGSTDVPISEHGRKQIEKSKDYINNLSWKKVYSSPMRRCLETAEALGIAKEDICIKDDLREMAAGIWENLTFAEIKEKYPQMYEERGKALGIYAVEGAESFQQAGERFGKCLDDIRRETDEDILVIAHAGVIRGYLCALAGKSYDDVQSFPMPYGGVTMLREKMDDSERKLEIVGVGRRSIDLLDKEGVEAIYKKCQTPENVIAHMRMVAQVVNQIVNDISQEFCPEEKDAVEKAALLHDICRTEKMHAEKSAKVLAKEGYQEISDIVAMHHSDKQVSNDQLTLEEILFYADKKVQGDKIVSVDERFAKSFEKCRGIPEAEAKHRRLYEKTLAIEKKIK